MLSVCYDLVCVYDVRRKWQQDGLWYGMKSHEGGWMENIMRCFK